MDVRRKGGVVRRGEIVCAEVRQRVCHFHNAAIVVVSIPRAFSKFVLFPQLVAISVVTERLIRAVVAYVDNLRNKSAASRRCSRLITVRIKCMVILVLSDKPAWIGFGFRPISPNAVEITGSI